MKRLIAYIGILFTMILSVCVMAKPVLTNVSTGYDYGTAKQYVYQITDLDNSITDQAGEMIADGAIDEIAKEFETRLESYGVETYNITTQGDNMISVSFSAQNKNEYDHISSYLAFDGNLTLTTYDSEYIYSNYRGENLEGSEPMFGVEDAYIVRETFYPALVIPLEDPETFQQAVDHAQELNDQATSDDEEQSTEVSNEGRFYLWSNWKEGDTFEAANNNVNIQRKLILYFDYNNIWYEQTTDEHKSICIYFNVEGSEDATDINDINWNNVATANENAKYYMHLMNASHLNYRVNLLYSNDVNPLVEELVNLQNNISVNVSTTLICFIAAYLVILFIASVLYRVNGFNLIISAGFAFVILLAIVNGIGSIFTVASLIGCVASLVLFISSNLIYAHKLKVNLEKGKTIKKAYLDASKSASILTVDISIVTLILGAIIYLLGGSFVSGFGVALFFASIINLLMNPIINRIMTYFFINTSICQKHLSLLGVTKVEKPSEEVEQKEEKDATVEKKKVFTKQGIVGIVFALLTVASITTITYFGVTSSPFEETNLISTPDKIYLRVEDDNLEFSEINQVEQKLDYISFEGLDENEKIYTNVTTHEYTDYTNDNQDDSVQYDYIIYEINLSDNIDVNENLFTYESESGLALDEALDLVFADQYVDIAPSSNYGTVDTFRVSEIALASSIAIICASIYLMIRFGLSRGLAALLISFMTSGFALSIFAMIRIQVNMYIGLAALFVMVLTLLAVTISSYLNKESLKESKIANLTIDDKENISKKNTKEITLYILFVIASSFLITLIFTGFSVGALQNVFAISMLCGSVISCLLVLIIYEPFTFALMKLINKIVANRKPSKNKKKALKQQHKQRQRGKELEEATFIGIND